MNKTVQRIFIWIIAIVMVVGTIGMFVAVILQNDNAAREQEELTKRLQQAQNCQPAAAPEGSMYTKPEAVTFDKEDAKELRSEDVKPGEGTEITSSDQCVTVHYLGNSADGTIFDNSYDRNEPTAFVLSQVIPGWQEGLMGMKVGGARKIYIPAEKAYGESAPTGYPSGPLYFYVELIDVK